MRVLLIWVGLVLIVVANANEMVWSNFQVKFEKTYKTETELLLRQKIFNDSLQQIEEHNKKYEQGLVSYKLGINKFADLTDEEFAAKFKTIELDENTLQSGTEYAFKTNGSQPLPESIDWRSWNNTSVVTGVKNQGDCGSCWAFSTTGSIESHLAIQYGELKSLSEQQLVDCDTIKNQGCKGGAVQYAYEYIAENGLTLEANYPYQAVSQTCSSAKRKKQIVWTKEYVNILRNNETQLKLAVGTVGPVSVAVNAVPIKSYKKGIFSGACSDKIDHAVLVVGYGIDNITGMPYWILKNSWGTAWGDQGYYKMEMGRNLCGIAKQACFPLISTDSGYSIKLSGFYLSIVFILAIIRLI